MGRLGFTTAEGPEGITSRGHDETGVERTREFLGRMTSQRRLLDEVLPLVREHMRPHELFRAGATDAAVRRIEDESIAGGMALPMFFLSPLGGALADRIEKGVEGGRQLFLDLDVAHAPLAIAGFQIFDLGFVGFGLAPFLMAGPAKAGFVRVSIYVRFRLFKILSALTSGSPDSLLTIRGRRALYFIWLKL